MRLHATPLAGRQHDYCCHPIPSGSCYARKPVSDLEYQTRREIAGWLAQVDKHPPPSGQCLSTRMLCLLKLFQYGLLNALPHHRRDGVRYIAKRAVRRAAAGHGDK